MKKYNKNFIDIRLSRDTAYVYSVRLAIQKAIDKNILMFQGVLLDLGCGEMPYKQYLIDNNKFITKYIGVDIDYSKHHQVVKPDIIWDGAKIDLPSDCVDTVIATELFEHIKNLDEVLCEINRVLKTGGTIFFTVPFIWPLHEVPTDQYRYTPYSLMDYLEKSGFKNSVIVPLGGYNASLAQMISIWMVNRRNDISSKFRRKLYGYFEKYILFFIIKKLLAKDEQLNVISYGENTMPTGFYGYAKK